VSLARGALRRSGRSETIGDAGIEQSPPAPELRRAQAWLRETTGACLSDRPGRGARHASSDWPMTDTVSG